MLEACQTRTTSHDVLGAYVVDRLNDACPRDLSDLSKRNSVAQGKSCDPSVISCSTPVVGAFHPATSTRRVSPVDVDGEVLAGPGFCSVRSKSLGL